MATVVADLTDLPRDEWLALRRRGIGGSDAPAIMGYSPFASPVSVWLDKLGQTPDDDETEAMWWGRELEEVIARGFQREHPEFTVVDCKKLYRHDDHQFMLATPDRLLADKTGRIVAGLELKNVGAYMTGEWASDDDDDMPAHVLIQSLHYSAVLDLPWYVAGLGGGNRLFVKRADHDPEFVAELIDIEAEFWSLVETAEMPPMDGHGRTSDALAALYPRGSDSAIDLDVDALGALRSLLDVKAQIKLLEEEHDEHANRLKAFLGEHSRGMVGDEVAVTWNTSFPRRLSAELVKDGYPDVYEACRPATTQRTLLPKKSKTGAW